MREDLLTTWDVVAATGLSYKRVVGLIDSGRLRGYRIPGSTHRRVPAASLAAFLAAAEPGFAEAVRRRADRRAARETFDPAAGCVRVTTAEAGDFPFQP